MTDARSKSLMRSLGEFFGHVARAVRTDPAPSASKREVRREVEEERRADGVILRRTTIEEIELPSSAPQPPLDGDH